MKKNISIIFLLFFFASINAEVYNGSCGQNLRWRLDTEIGSLNITGSGAMTDYSFLNYAPWRSRNLDNKILSISLPSALTHIGNAAFVNCSYATTINIPDNVIDIGNSAFYACGFEEIKIGEGVKVINAQAFHGCIQLKSIYIPRSVDSIGSEAFLSCSKLKEVHIEDLSKWCRVIFYNGHANPLRYAEHLYLNDIEIKNLIIPNDVTRIANGVFFFCKSINTIFIHKNVTNIGSACFGYCTGLHQITCEAIEPPVLGDMVFDEVDKSIPLYVPFESIDKYKSTDQWRDFHNIHSIEEAESIESVTSSSENSTKIIQNGQVVIQNGEKTYTITGAKIK